MIPEPQKIQGEEERAKYGDGLIKEYSKRLTTELGKGYSTRMLKRMRLFYLLIQKGTPLAAQFKNINITWSNVCKIIKKNSDYFTKKYFT